MDVPDAREKFLSDIPRLHSWDGGQTWKTGGFARRELEAIIELLRVEVGTGAFAAETGAGNSTLAMLIGGAARVTSIAPDPALFERIRRAAAAIGIDDAALDPVVSMSEDKLPSISEAIEEGGRLLDVALIDGGHGWPTVFVDFCYLNRVLRRGGFLMLDDIQIYSVKELARLLGEDSNFLLYKKLPKTLIFQKRTAARYLADHGGQPYIKRRSLEERESGRAFAVE